MDLMELVNSMAVERTIETRKTKDGDNFANIPEFNSGDNVTVAYRVIEGEKERIQNFQGVVLSKRGSGINASFLVRKISNGVGVERIFPLYSPMIQSITLNKKGIVRRAKLYYLRGMSEKKIRQKLR
jgi:large subunit ribosomal protein L19